jgi:hypothetical protein
MHCHGTVLKQKRTSLARLRARTKIAAADMEVPRLDAAQQRFSARGRLVCRLTRLDRPRLYWLRPVLLFKSWRAAGGRDSGRRQRHISMQARQKV